MPQKTDDDPLLELPSDQAIQQVGGCGRFQIIALILVCFTFSTASMVSYGLPYLQNKSEVALQCHYPDGTESLCHPDEACSDAVSSFTYITDPSKGLVNWVDQYHLACRPDSDFSLLSTVYFTGYCLACIIFLPLIDCVGRKPVILTGLLLHLIFNIVLFVYGNWTFLFFFVAVIGLRSPMACQAAFLLLIQLTDPRWRAVNTMIISSTDGSYYMWLALVYKYIADWRPWFYFITGVIIICFAGVMFYLPESPRFYISRGRFARARAQYTRVARVNGKPALTAQLQGENSLDSDSPKVHVCDLWRGRTAQQKAIMIVLPFFWMVSDIISFGLTFSLNKLNGDIYLYGIILGSATLVVAFSVGFVAEWIGRKPTFAILWILNILGSLAYQWLSYTDLLRYIFVFIAKIGANGAFGMCYIVTSQLFPTRYRGLVFGIGNMGARLGGILAPQFSTTIAPNNFVLVFAGLSFITLCLTPVLRETKGLKMPDLPGKSRSPNPRGDYSRIYEEGQGN